MGAENVSVDLGGEVKSFNMSQSSWHCITWHKKNVTSGATETMNIPKIYEGFGISAGDDFRDSPVSNVNMNFRFARNSNVITQIPGEQQSYTKKWNGTKYDRVPGGRYRCSMEAQGIAEFQIKFKMQCDRIN